MACETGAKNNFSTSLSVNFLETPMHHETVATTTNSKVININDADGNIAIDFPDNQAVHHANINGNLLSINACEDNIVGPITEETIVESEADRTEVVEDLEMTEDQTSDIQSMVSQPSYLLFSIPNPAQTPLLDMPVYVLSNHLTKDNIEANIVLEQQKRNVDHMLHLQELAHANLITATQESIARTFGMETQDDKKARKLYTCKECGRGFKSSTNRKYHMELHKGNKVLKCTFAGCERRFSWPTHLQYHLKTHTNNRQYVCDVPHCAKAFFTEQRLVVHRRTHTGVRPFACAEKGCHKSFTTAGNLRNHIRTHTGEKPYICNMVGCAVQFSERSSLRKHMLTHTGEKPYKCEVCGKLFTQIGSRNTHIKRKHGDTNSPINLESKNDTPLISDSLVQLQELAYTSLNNGRTVSSSSNAAVVVLSQPHAAVASHLHDQVVSREDIVYGNDLLQSELNQNISHNIHVTGDMVGTQELTVVRDNGTLPMAGSQKGIVGLDTMIHGNNSDDDTSSNVDSEESIRMATRQMYCQ